MDHNEEEEEEKEEEEEEDNFERYECDFMRKFLTNYVNETFKDYGVSTVEIEGETTEEIWENMYERMDELLDEIDENEDKEEEEYMDEYLEEAEDYYMRRGVLPGQRKRPKPLRDKKTGIASRRHQLITASVGANIDHFFSGEGLQVDSVPNIKMYKWTGISTSEFKKLVQRCIDSRRFVAPGVDVPVSERKPGCGRGIPIPIGKKVFLAMEHLKAGRNGQASDTCFGISTSTINQFIKKFVSFVSEILFPEEVYFDFELLKQNEQTYARLGVPGAAASIDGTKIDWLSCPTNMRRTCRNGRGQNKYGFNVQIACGQNRRICHVGDLRGAAVNDLELYNLNELSDFVQNDQRCKNFKYYHKNMDGDLVEKHGLYFITDGIYQKQHTLCGHRYLDILDVEECNRRKQFNAYMASLRKDIECTFGCIQQVYKVMQLPFIFKSVQTCNDVLRTCCYFWNLRLKHNGRYALGTEVEHFKVLNGEDEYYPHVHLGVPNALRYDDEADDENAYAIHLERQTSASNHFYKAHNEDANVFWLRSAEEVFPTNLK